MLRRLIYFLYELLILRVKLLDVFKEYKLIKSNIFNSFNINLNIQKERLFNILDYTIKYVPYYRKLANENNIVISRNSIFEDIKQFPTLTKEIIRKNWNLLHPDLSGIKYVINASGGTTGEPVKIIQTNDYLLKRKSAVLVFDEISGYKVGDRIVKLWGDEKEIIQKTKGLLKIVYTFFKNTIFQNSFRMSEKIILQYINQINRKKPKIIITYAQSIFEIVKYIKRKNLEIFKIDSIITSAGVLSKKVKMLIEEVFGCRVYNRYGSREVGLIAMSCKESDKLHINMYHQYIEILNEYNEILGEHEKGNIIITNLINYGMPLIRYKIGDIGSIDKSTCNCGINLIRLEKVYGRTVGIFKNEKGELIDGEYFTHLFYFMENLKKFQIIQEEINKITLFLVTVDNNHLSKEIEEDLKYKIKIVMGNNCEIIINYVSKIKVPKSGKFQYTISKV